MIASYYGNDDDDFDLEDEDDFEVKTDQIDEVLFFCEAFSGNNNDSSNNNNDNNNYSDNNNYNNNIDTRPVLHNI